MNYRVTISMPVFGRPIATIKALNSIVEQTAHGWQALCIGDACPAYGEFIKSHEARLMVARAAENGNSLILLNNERHCGHHGFEITNSNIACAEGKYFCFMANDDIILPNHLQQYLAAIENTSYDFVYFDSFVKPLNSKRISSLNYGHIGHSELIIRTDYLRKMPPHSPEYGHDWELVENMLLNGASHKKAIATPTYHVLSIPDKRENQL